MKYLRKIVVLNQTSLDSMVEKNSKAIIKNFTEAGIKIMDADFGFAWWKFDDDKEYKLAYKSPDTPYEPNQPRENAGNYIARKTKRPFFDSDVQKGNYSLDITNNLKSYIIIPIHYDNHTYGSLVFCYVNKQNFGKTEIELAVVLGTTTAQAITINRLIVNEKKAKLSLQKQEKHFRSLIENSQEIIAHVDVAGKILYVNKAAERITGIKVRDIIGRNIQDFNSRSEVKLKRFVENILRDPNKNHVQQFDYKNKDKTSFFLEGIASPITEDASVGGVVINIRDITKAKKLSEMKVVKKLLQIEKNRIEAIADATHELRTPVAVIKGNVDLALNGKSAYSKDPKTALKAIDVEISHLSNILLDLSMVTSEKAKLTTSLSYKKINLKSIIGAVVERSKTFARKKNIKVVTKKMPNIELYGDQIHLEKMFMNLVKNSIIYGNKNGLTTVVTTMSKEFVKVDIIDNGIGIRKADLPHVFERFYRADKSHSSGGKSTGLGLAIVKWVAESHGGKVSVKSNPSGTTFSVFLPLKLNSRNESIKIDSSEGSL